MSINRRGRPGCTTVEVLVRANRQANRVELLGGELSYYGGGEHEAGDAVEGEGVIEPRVVRRCLQECRDVLVHVSPSRVNRLRECVEHRCTIHHYTYTTVFKSPKMHINGYQHFHYARTSSSGPALARTQDSQSGTPRSSKMPHQ